MALHVVQGERDLVADCRSLARFELRGIPPMAAGAARIRVTFTVDADGLLSVAAKEQGSGVEARIDVKPSYGLTDDEIARMLQDGFATAAQDMKVRAVVEARVDADQIRDLVFGLGLNLNGRGADLPRELQKTAISLADATGAPLDLNRFAAALIGRVLAAYDQFLAGNYRDKFAELWQRYDVLRGRAVSVTQGTRTVAGTATGIDNEGSLIVRLPSGRSERFRAGEVTLSREAAPAV